MHGSGSTTRTNFFCTLWSQLKTHYPHQISAALCNRHPTGV
jgi:hypothetical protein